MRAIILEAKEQVAVVEVPKPKLLGPKDVIIRVSLCSICGSDLHPYHQREVGIAAGTIVGHEFVGVVEEKGEQVTSLGIGDRVMSPFTTSCGTCFYCRKGLTCRCEHEEAQLFGWVNEGEEGDGSGLQGSQAQFVRVPLADSTLVKVPPTLSDEAAILLGDILSTAFFCADRGHIRPGNTVAVVGCGPVGILACLAAQKRGAQKVFAVDQVEQRLQLAAKLGACPVPLPEALETIKGATGGRGADVVLEVVGLSPALRLAYELVRPAGVISSVGVHTAPEFPFSPVEGYDKNVTYCSGRCPARHYMEELLDVAQAHQSLFTQVITHRMPLSRGREAYEMFDKKMDGCVKVVLDPWA